MITKRYTSSLKAAAVILVLATPLAVSPAIAGEYYKWVDEKGVPHFSERPAQVEGLEKIKTNARKPTPQETSPDEEAVEKEAQGAKQTQADPERCSIAQERLKSLTSGSRIRMSDGNGGFTYLEKNQIEQEIQRSRKAISESCE